MMKKLFIFFVLGLGGVVSAAGVQNGANNPDEFTTIMSVLNNPVMFSVLVGELQSTKTNALLESKDPNSKITLFAPTDKALNDFGQIGVLRGTPLLAQFLKQHMISGRWDRNRLRSRRTAQMMSGKQINIKDIGKIAYTVETDNGIIHVIHKVILNAEIKKKLGIKDS